MWKAGDRAYCIKTPVGATANYPNGKPVEGQIYFVNDIFVSCTGNVGLKLAGYPVFVPPIGEHAGWARENFRKVHMRTNKNRNVNYESAQQTA